MEKLRNQCIVDLLAADISEQLNIMQYNNSSQKHNDSSNGLLRSQPGLSNIEGYQVVGKIDQRSTIEKVFDQQGEY